MIPRGPVTWVGLGLVGVAAASGVSYYQIERERRLEQAMGKIVSPTSLYIYSLYLVRLVTL